MAKAGFNANHPQFSPDGQSILALGGTRAGRLTMQLLLYRIPTRTFTLLQLSPKTSWVPKQCAAWSPDSKTVLCVLAPARVELGALRAQRVLRMCIAAVDAASAAVSYQSMNMAGVCTEISWGAANYVALACTDLKQQDATVYLCLAMSSPLRITMLHKLSTGMVITHLSCAPLGLLCSWVEVVDKYWDLTASTCVSTGEYDIGKTIATVVVAKFATGHTAEVAKLASPGFMWDPTTVTDKEPQRRPVQAHWAPDGLSVFLLKPTTGCKCSYVQQLIF